jgi:hypothetical protein
MKIAARLGAALSVAGLGFLTGFVATFVVNLAVSGFGEFDGDAGAKFAELGESVVVGFVFGLLGFWLGARLSQRIPLDHAPNEIGED